MRHGSVSSAAERFRQWLCLIGGFILGTLTALVAIGSPDVTTALVGLVGVALGGVISAAITRESQRAQIVAAIWPERVRAHQECYDLTLRLTFANLLFEEHQTEELIAESHSLLRQKALYLSSNAKVNFKMLVDLVAQHDEDAKDIKTSAYRRIEDAEAMALRSLMEGVGDQVTDDFLRQLVRKRPTGDRQTSNG